MGFTVEQECPQCGATIEIDETDHLLRCPYCEIKNYLYTPNYYRYLLPHKAPGKEILYAPYLRFKGNVFFCMEEMTVGHRFVDITNAGLELNGIPVSLGLRPQAMKMKFVTPKSDGSFLKFTRKATDILTQAGRLSSGKSTGKILHKAYIGETMSLIYLPMYIENNKLFDAILLRPLIDFPGGFDAIETSLNQNPKWKIQFIPTLCPQCGWNLDGERDSIVLTCGNCYTAWEAVDGKFTRVNLSVIPGKDNGSIYLPFWKTTARTKGVEIHSFADFIRITNQPRIVDKSWEKEEMNYWSPAFKIRPKTFLTLSRQLTISQKHFQSEEILPKKNLFPVTLPRSEATQSMKVVLAESAITKKNIFPHLPHTRFKILESTLVYLPFTDTGHEMVQQHMSISINKQTLMFGRQL